MLKDPGPRCFHYSVGLLRAVLGARAETRSVLSGLTWHLGFRLLVGGGGWQARLFFHQFVLKALARCSLGHLFVLWVWGLCSFGA